MDNIVFFLIWAKQRLFCGLPRNFRCLYIFAVVIKKLLYYMFFAALVYARSVYFITDPVHLQYRLYATKNEQRNKSVESYRWRYEQEVRPVMALYVCSSSNVY